MGSAYPAGAFRARIREGGFAIIVLTVISGALALLCGLLFIYPYVIFPVTLRLLRRRPLDVRVGPSDGEGFALFFCAYNEAKVLGQKLQNIRELVARYPQLQVFAYDDASTDGTRAMLEAASDVLTLVPGAGRTGKARGMKEMVAKTSADYLVFTDANVILDVNAIHCLGGYYADPTVGGVCGSLHYRSSSAPTATEASGGLYWKLEEATKSLESRTGNVMGADGSLFSVRSEHYPDFPDTVLDDFTVSMAVVFNGSRLVKAEDVIAYEGLVADRADELRRKIRIATRSYHTHLYLRKCLKTMTPIDRYKYVGHKLLRWWGAVPLAVGSVAAVICLASMGLIGLAVLGMLVLFAVGVRYGAPRKFDFLIDLISAVFATFRGVIKASRGETFQVWTPPATR